MDNTGIPPALVGIYGIFEAVLTYYFIAEIWLWLAGKLTQYNNVSILFLYLALYALLFFSMDATKEKLMCRMNPRCRRLYQTGYVAFAATIYLYVHWEVAFITFMVSVFATVLTMAAFDLEQNFRLTVFCYNVGILGLFGVVAHCYFKRELECETRKRAYQLHHNIVNEARLLTRR